jgi:hypothetical protein
VVRLDEKAGNTKWQDSTKLEMAQLDDYDTVKDYGHHSGRPPKGYKKIRVHLIFTVKHDGRHKSRLVADGDLTNVPIDSVYFGVVSLRGLRLLMFLAELNGFETWATDIGNAYLEAEMLESVFIVAGPEFGEREGHTLVFFKALYGLRTSGLRWHERFADCLRDMSFEASKSEPDIWMRKNCNIYEYIAVYVDDLAIAAKDPKSITDILMDKHKFKLKGTGPITYHFGCDFFCDSNGIMCMAPNKYIDKMVSTYEQMSGCKPCTQVSSPLEKGDHPKIDTSELLDDIITGRSVTGILHLVNKTPIDWYSKKQATVEIATYGLEYVAARTCVVQVMDLRLTLRYLRVPIRDKSYMCVWRQQGCCGKFHLTPRQASFSPPTLSHCCQDHWLLSCRRSTKPRRYS